MQSGVGYIPPCGPGIGPPISFGPFLVFWFPPLVCVGGLTILVNLGLVKCRLVEKAQKIRLFSDFCLESVALWSVSGPGFYSSVSLHS